MMRQYRAALILCTTVAVTLLLIILWRVEGTRTLRWAHVYEISSPFHQQTLIAAREFEERTNGRYRVRVYPASALGKESAINESLALGAIDIIYTGASLVANEYPPIALSDFPYAIDNFEHWQAYRDSSLFEEMATAFGRATDTEVIGLTYYGFRHVTANKPILHPDDMRGLKIRVPNAPMYLILPRATRANAAPMPFSEVYLALQQGVIDAQENPLTTIRLKRFYEVQSHINLTGHIAPSLLTLVSHRTLDELGEEDAALLKDVADRAARRASEEIAADEVELVEWFVDKGLTVTEVDRDAFRKAVDAYFEDHAYPFDASYLTRLRELAKP
ncbi:MULTISPECIES: sialic acid TRAP transporter substrate-binding protein SiaP [Marinimicrobium]|uniref:sialic acid TRAP transporter substrate-binding protein SiaP n=1 Tax=Marinimicrobium TaxID=359337 RepID=UPI0003FB5645|nr:sialic acid TRAP transporter substrate-binding protein SiaP [Marinimicrobium agarilyticum]